MIFGGLTFFSLTKPAQEKNRIEHNKQQIKKNEAGMLLKRCMGIGKRIIYCFINFLILIPFLFLIFKR